jgi:SMI1 / KNR4 family (SUKH-1)
VAIEDLIAVVPPPTEPRYTGTPEQLTQIEASLGSALPLDYREFILRYGAGTFVDGYLQFWSPFVVDLRERASSQNSFIQVHYDSGALPWPPFPATPGLLEMGGNENGHRVLYLCDGQPDKWPLIIVPHGWENQFERWEIPLTTFLARALKNEIQTAAVNISQPVKLEERTFTPLKAPRVKSRKRK